MALRSSRQSTRQGLSKFGPPLQTGELTGNGPNNFSVENPLTRLSQADQDKADEEKQRESIHTLVQTWLDSLQLISVINTFFVATEASWLVITIPSSTDTLSAIGQLANIGIISAFIVHGHAAIISFFGAFYLIRYKLTVAQEEEEEAEEILADSPKRMSLNDPEKVRDSRDSPHANNLPPVCRRIRVNSPASGDQIIWSTNPHLVQVGPFQGQPPTELLARCHSLCVFLSFLGFLLALMGAMSFTWDRLPRIVSIFTTITTVFCVVAAVLMLIVPSTKTSHIFYNHKSR